MTPKQNIDIQDEPAFHLNAREGNMCGEVGRIAHWEQMLQCSDGRFVHGYGLTKEEAELEAKGKREVAEKEIAQLPKEQIKTILDRCGERIYDSDLQRLIRLLCKVITT